MTADQPTLCPSCQGVLVVLRPGAYTPARARLIVTNGYCQGRCAAPERDERTRTEPTSTEPTSTEPTRTDLPLTAVTSVTALR
ncbi:hypothetical protein [Nonomuraea sp. NPDC050643]|uniref:hypothetical protein n=1 Tax=Nonomuraea sp. NPDC050643 TaxID=3155660 RepID=UPI0033CCCB37